MTAESDLARIARIGDSVFAVIITLLAYRVRIPSFEALSAGKLVPLLPFLGDLGAVVLSFVVASTFWLSHWRVFRRMRHSDVKFVVLNLAFFGALILLPISTRLISGEFTRMGMMAYSANLFLVSTAILFLRRHGRRIDPQAFGPGRVLLSTSLTMLLFGLAAVTCLFAPVVSIVLWSCALATPWVDQRWGLGRAG